MARATPRRVNEELRQIIETTKEHPLARPVTDSIMGDRDSPSAGATNVVVDEYIKLLVLRNRKFVRRHLSAEAVVLGGWYVFLTAICRVQIAGNPRLA